MSTKDLYVHWLRSWQKKHGRSYPNVAWAKHQKLFKGLIKTVPPLEVKELIDYYFERYTSAFATKAADKFEVFYSLLPEVTAQLAEAEKKQAKPSTDYDRLDQARKALRGTESK